MKKNKIISILLLFITAFFFSCKNEIKIHTPENNGQSFTITGKIENPHNQLGARYVQPDVSSFVYKITAKNGADTVTSTSTTATYTISLTKGTWTLIVEGFLGNDKAVVNSSTSVLISDEIPFQVVDETSTPEVASLKIKSDTNGEIDLSINVTDPSIKSCSLIINGGTAINGTVSNSKVHFSKSSLSTGTYSALFTFYDDSGNEICSYSDVITILAGQKTAKFVNNGNPFIDTSGNFNVTQEIVSGLHDKTVYVSFTNQPSNGKIPSGKIIDPFPNLQTAVDYINRSNTGECTYYIKILNNIMADYSTDSVFCNIESVKDLDLTIESYGSEVYTINASKQSSNPGRAFNISGKNDSQLNLTLKNIKVTGGFMEAETGSQAAAGVYIGENATLKLDGEVDIQSVGGAQDGCVIVNDTILAASKFVYFPNEYKVATIIVSGAGKSIILGNITIPSTVIDSEEIEWELSAEGKLKKTKIYISEMIEEPSEGMIIYVKKAEDLKALSDFVNDGLYTTTEGTVINLNKKITFKDVTVVQEKDINLNGINWVPIGLRDVSSSIDKSVFMGYYNGNNKSIENVSMTNSYSSSAGVFGNIRDSVISDLTADVNITTLTSDPVTCAGGIVAYATSSTISNCSIKGNIAISKAATGGNIGGICGNFFTDGKIENCTSLLSLLSVLNGDSVKVGGIAGRIFGTVTINNCVNESTMAITNSTSTDNYIGGITGDCIDSSITNCINKNNITTSGPCWVGGIAGLVEYTDNYIVNNYSNITTVGGKIAGIVGNIEFGTDCVELENCIAEISASGSDAAYGIVNGIYSSNSNPVSEINNCFWYQDVQMELRPSGITGVSVNNSCSFSPDSSEWYGNLTDAIVCGTDKKTKALVYALNCWVNENTASIMTLNTWCVKDGKLAFGDAPAGEPLYTPIVINNLAHLSFIPQAGDELIVETKDDLFALAKLVNEGTNANNTVILSISERNLSGVFIKQTQPIDLENEEWEPIGSFAKSATFKGFYDGNEYPISNMKVSAATDVSPGLFGRVTQDTDGGGIIKNVIVNGEITITGNNTAYVGGIVSELTSGEVYNCVSEVSILNSSSNDLSYSGGVVGRVSGSAYVYNCEYRSEISLNNYSKIAGGIVGKVDGTGNNCIYNCINNGSIVSENATVEKFLGGIVGSVSIGNTNIFNNCNNGKIEGKDGSYGSAGGIIGTFNSSASGNKISNCINTASVTGLTSNYSICGAASTSYNSNTISIKHCFGIDSVDLNALTTSNSNVTIENLSKYTLDTSGGTLANAIDGTTIVLEALNAWVDDYNGTAITRTCENWVYDSTGLHFGTPSSGKNYVSELSAADLVEGATYYVGTAEDLKSLANLVNIGKSFEGITIVQDKLIDLNNDEWTPIGNNGETFSGTYLGNGHEITGLKISSLNTTNSPGLFGNLYEATIDGVNVSGTITSNAEYIGGITSSISCSTLKNCISSVNIQCSDTSSTMNYIGGLVGLAVYDGNYGSDIDNCCYVGEVTVSNKIRAAGGIAGGVACGTSLNISNTVNRGNVTYSGSVPSTTEVSLAGFIGELLSIDGSDCSGAEITNCGNKGSVTGVTAGSGAYCYASGFVCTVGNSSVCHIENCFNISEISGADANTAFYTNKRQNSSITYIYIYWDYELVEKWKNEGKSDDASQLWDSDVIRMKQIEGYSAKNGYLAMNLNKWVDSEDSTLYKTWLINFFGKGNQSQGSGTPYLDYEAIYY